MNKTIICQGRYLQKSDLCWLRNVTQDHLDWSRHKITKHICSQWGWYTHSGQPKTFAARSMIDRLDQRGLLDFDLPPIRVSLRRKPRPPFPEGFTAIDLKPINQPLEKLTPHYLSRFQPQIHMRNIVWGII